MQFILILALQLCIVKALEGTSTAEIVRKSVSCVLSRARLSLLPGP